MRKIAYIVAICFLLLKSAVYAGWNIETIEDSSVFRWPVIAIGSDDRLHVAYIRNYGFSPEIKYVPKTDVWDTSITGTQGPAGVTGHISMDLDSSDKPHISYSGGASNELFYSSWDSGGWQHNLQYILTDVKYTSIALGNDDTRYISFFRDDPIDMVEGLMYTTSYNSWATQEGVHTGAPSPNLGLGSSIVVDNNNNINISYYNGDSSPTRINYIFKHRDEAPAIWSSNKEAVNTNNYIKGQITSLALDKVDGRPNVVYMADSYVYFSYRDQYGTWSVPELVASNGGSAYVAMDVRDQEDPHIVYYDINGGSIKYARKYRDGRNGWDIQVIEENVGSYAGEGFCPSIKLDSQGNPHIVYYNDNQQILKYASLSEGSDDVDQEVEGRLKENKDVIIGNNKFNPDNNEGCRVIYKLSGGMDVTIKVYDLAGNLVKTIVENEFKDMGTHAEDEWFGKDKNDNAVASGIYYIKVEGGESFKQVKKVAIVKQGQE
jgi:hypothetical protein